MENNHGVSEIKGGAIFTSSLLVLGNVLGVGVLALPITAGLGGFIPAVIGTIVIWLFMLFAAWLIASKINPNEKNFDLPSFYKEELGTTAKWIAIICNLIILYGVLVAYLSGFSSMLAGLFPALAKFKSLIIIIYFIIVIGLILYGIKALRKGMVYLMIALWICFILMVISGSQKMEPKFLLFTDWKYIPIVLPIAVSAFHFHNIIPTVYNSLNHNKKATYKAIFIGVLIGLFVNLVWVILVLGTLPENGAGVTSIVYANVHSYTANVPMSAVLQSKVFSIAGLIFACLAITSSFMTNGAGLFGFINDICYHYLKNNNKMLVGCIAFLPPLIVTLVYPNLFLKALSIVGGVGEDILFGILPAIIILKIAKHFPKHKASLRAIGYVMFFVCLFVLIFVLGQKFDLINLAPPTVKM